jgi:tetratricopeptide (TPR) repeat protein
MKTYLTTLKKVFVFCSIIIIAVSCSSGLQQLKNGNFDESIFLSVSRLQDKPNHQKALTVLKEAYPLAIEEHKRAIRVYENSSEPFHWEKALAEYQQLNQIYDVITRKPTIMQIVGVPQNYVREAETARQLAADDRYQAGIVALEQKENRLAAKDAFGQFQRANDLIPNYKEANQKAEEAFQYALHRVTIEPIFATIGLYRDERQTLQEHFDYAFFRPKAKLPSPFVRYYTTNSAREESLPQNDLVKFVLVNMSSPRVDVETKTEHFSKQIKTGRKKINDSTFVDVFETVKACITTYNKRIEIRGSMEMQVHDYRNNSLIDRDLYHANYVWTDSYQTFSGNVEALDGRACPSNGSWQFEPSSSSLFDSLSGQFAGYFCRELDRTYRKM